MSIRRDELKKQTDGIRVWQEFSLVVCVTISLTFVLLLTTEVMTYEHPAFARPYDHHLYIQMATVPFRFHSAPFCWRILVPLLAGIMPFGLEYNFLILSFIGIAATGVTVYYLVKATGSSKMFAFIGLLLFFSFGWAVEMVMYDFWLPDAMSFLFITLGIYFAYTKNDMGFLLSLAVGVLVKESVIFVAPLYYTLNTKRIVNTKLMARTVMLTGLAIAILISLRFMIPATNDYSYYSRFREVGLQRLNSISLSTLKDWSAGTYGELALLLPLFSLKKNVRHFLRFTPFFLLIYSQLFFAVNTQRLLVIGFPAIILLSLNGLQYLQRAMNVHPNVFLPLSLLMYAVNLIYRSFSSPFGIQAIIFVLYLALLFQIQKRDMTSNFIQ